MEKDQQKGSNFQSMSIKFLVQLLKNQTTIHLSSKFPPQILCFFQLIHLKAKYLSYLKLIVSTIVS